MAWTRSDMPPQTGRVVVVTGANAGLGLETARALAGAGAHVVMAARDADKAAAAADGIRAGIPGASLELVTLDLADLGSVAEAAATILRRHDQLGLLVNNAGLMAIPPRRTADGFEMQFGVNHLGHWALTARLLPLVLATPGARVVTVTSVARHTGRTVDPEDPHLERAYGPWSAYGRSKLANFHFGFGLQRGFERAGADAASLIAHPGLSNTGLQARSVAETGGLSQRIFHAAARWTGMTPADGALSQLRAATDPRARGGGLYAPRWVTNGPPVRRPILRRWDLDGAVETLWRVSEDQTGQRLELPPGT